MRLLGIDPSLRNTGWAVIDCDGSGEFLVDAGCIKTVKGAKTLHTTLCEDDTARTDKISSGIADVVEKYNVLMSAIEGRAGSRNSRSAEAMTMAFATVMTSLHLVGVSRMIISPMKAKSIVSHHIKGRTKETIKDEVIYRLGAAKWQEALEGIPRKQHEHCFDAAAVALASLGHPSLLYIRRKEMLENGANKEAVGVRSVDDSGELHGPTRCG